MNAFKSFDYLRFTVIAATVTEVSHTLWASCHHPVLTRELQDYLSLTGRDPQEWLDECKSHHLEQVGFDLAWAYLSRPPSGYHHTQYILWEPRNQCGHTLLMGNSRDGSQHATGSIRIHVPWQIAFVGLNDPPGEYPTYWFEYFSDYEHVRRLLFAGVDTEDERRPRWHWGATGPVQPFENPEYYTRPQIKDRLNRKIIVEYMDTLGYDIQHDDFWQTDQPAWLIWYDDLGRKTRPEKYSDPTK